MGGTGRIRTPHLSIKIRSNVSLRHLEILKVKYPRLKHVGLQDWFPSLTIGLLTLPANKVQSPINRKTERCRVVAVADVDCGIPVRIEHLEVRRIEPTALANTPFA